MVLSESDSVSVLQWLMCGYMTCIPQGNLIAIMNVHCDHSCEVGIPLLGTSLSLNGFPNVVNGLVWLPGNVLMITMHSHCSILYLKFQ